VVIKVAEAPVEEASAVMKVAATEAAATIVMVARAKKAAH
jgi:hypothetical protein